MIKSEKKASRDEQMRIDSIRADIKLKSTILEEKVHISVLIKYIDKEL